jgi:hypothetical protein
MPSALRPTASAWFPSASSYKFSPLNQAVPANFASQPFAASFMPSSNSFTRPFAPEPSYFAPASQSKFFAPESPPFYSQSFAPESPPFMHDHFSQPSTTPFYVHEQPLGHYSRAGFYVNTGVQYFYSHTPPRNNYPAPHLPPTPPSMDWQWAMGGAGANQGWAPNAQPVMQWGGEAEKTNNNKKKKGKKGKGKGWKNKKSEVKMGEEMNGHGEKVGGDGFV